VVNAGIDGQSTIGHIKNFDWWFPFVPDLNACYILVYVGTNDFYIDPKHYDYSLLTEQKSLRRVLAENSALYHLLRTIRGVYRAEYKMKVGHRKIDFSKREWTASANIQNHEEVMKNNLRDYKERLRILGDRIKKFGSVPVFVTQPCRKYREVNDRVEGTAKLSRYEDVMINGVDYYHMSDLLNRATLGVAEEVGGIPIDLAKEIEWDDDDFYDETHNTPKGAEKIGRHLHTELKHLFSD
jgi:hypothetical protein